jgi:hypothetical protein
MGWHHLRRQHPFAFVLTALSIILVIVLLGYAALGPDVVRHAASAAAWLSKM